MAFGGLTEAAGERQVLGGLEVLAREEDHLVSQPGLADRGNVVVGEVAEVEAAELGADGAGQRDDLEGRRCGVRPAVAVSG